MADKIARLGVGFLPGRKQPTLYEETGSTVRVLAYFRNEEAMKTFLEYEPSYTPYKKVVSGG